MRFRLKALGLHLAASICVLSLVLGALYLGWYHWPGWYLTGVTRVVLILIGVDAALGPLMTLLIASPAKPRRELARDVAIIVVVQIIGLAYGSYTLWQGRPLYYAFSVDRVELVQASDIHDGERALAHKLNPQLAPAWYRSPRWVWAPLPDDPKETQKILGAAVFGGGDDVIQMPRYFRPWQQGAAELRKRLKKVDQLIIFTRKERAELKQKMAALGLPVDASNAIMLTGNGRPLLLVFDPRTLRLGAMLAAD